MIKGILLSMFLAVQMFLYIPNISASFIDTLDDFQDDIEEESDNSAEEGEAIVLPNYQDEDDETGVSGITNAIFTFLDFFKLMVTPIAVLFIVIMGFRMVAAGRENEPVITASKTYIRYASEGLLVIFIADALIRNVVFGMEGEIFRQGESGAREFGRQATTFFEGIYGLIQVIIGSIAVFMIVMAGMRYVGGSASEDQIGTAKKQITWSLVGLFIVAISEFVAKAILFPEQGQDLGLDEAKDLMVQVTNFIAGTMGTLAFAFMIYAGYLYVTAAGNEDNVEKSKKIIIGAVIGIIFAASAFALTSTLVELEATR